VLTRRDGFEWNCENRGFTDVEIKPTYHLLSSLILTVLSHTVVAMIIGGVAKRSVMRETDVLVADNRG